jgi:predicted nucleic acid-binding protein
VITAVDSNVLIDVLGQDRRYAASAVTKLEAAASLGPVVMCDVVLAELAPLFPNVGAMDEFLALNTIQMEHVSAEVLFDAGHAWHRYTQQRGTSLMCSACGASSQPVCPQCGEALRSRQHMVADFIIGAHAMARADWLLTRDRGYYRTYFPELRLDS